MASPGSRIIVFSFRFSKKTASLVLSVIIICISVRHYRTSKGVRSNPSNPPPPSYAPAVVVDVVAADGAAVDAAVAAFVDGKAPAAAVVAIAITAVVTAAADAAHPIVVLVVAIVVAFVGTEQGMGREVAVDLAAVVNVDVGGHHYFGIVAHHLC